MKNKIIIVDDHTLFARALGGLIDSFAEYEVQFIFNNGAELVDKFTAGLAVPEIILLDVKMPIMDGISTMKWLKKYKPTAKVISISMEDDETTILSMIRNGAKGYLLKDTEPSIFKKALDTVLKKGYYHTELVTNSLTQALKNETNTTESNRFLKDREIEFLKLLCEEKTYREIATAMVLSPKTIDNYRESLFNKLKVRSRIGLVIYAIKNNIYTIR